MKNKIKKISLYLTISFILYELLTSMFFNLKLTSSNEEFLRMLFKDSNHYELYYKNDFINTINKKIISLNLKNPISILENTFKFKQKEPKMYVMKNASDSLEETNKASKYINDPSSNNNENPLVYIYNTHQLESYNKKVYEDYNITPNVMMASYILREKLNKKNINTIVETNNITDFLNANGWSYAYSYKASRYYLKDTLTKHKNLKLIIDLHRDSIKRNASTVEINGKSYAKVLFVVGLEHNNYKKNLETATKLNNIILKKYPKLTRGILKKQGKNVNGIYNQDLNQNIILIECGGTQNTIEEVMNTLTLLSEIIEEYIGG